MSAALLAALVFTVALLVTNAYFLMGSLPLLILKHDTPLDSWFIRGFFNVYYVVAVVAASATAVSLAFASKPAFAVGAAALALLSATLRRKIIPRMDALRSEIRAFGTDAIPGFRRMHLTATSISFVQLVLIVWSLVVLSLQMK